MRAVLAETLGDVLRFAAVGRAFRHLEHRALDTVRRLLPAIRAQDILPCGKVQLQHIAQKRLDDPEGHVAGANGTAGCGAKG